jgi:carboxylesterase type B
MSEGFSTGNSQSPAYNGARLANDKDVVVVSINYRVNIFGFHGARFLPDLNPGLLDQRLGVEWVRENIPAFGGDPKRIILFGQSAGGASVDFYSYAWTKDPIVYGFIPESGSAAIGSNSTNSSANWFSASKALNCGGEEAGEKTVECMRTKDIKSILAAIKAIGGGGMGAFGPRADGKVVFSDYAARRAAGNFIKAPVLIGNTDDEGGLTSALAAIPKGPTGPPKGTSPLSRRQTPPKAPNLASIGCGPHAAALGRIKAGVPAWRYLYNGVWPNQDIGSKGAWHGADIGMQFGTSEFLSHKPDTAEEKKMVETIMGAWTAFAKDPKEGLTKFGWPVYDPESEFFTPFA